MDRREFLKFASLAAVAAAVPMAVVRRETAVDIPYNLPPYPEFREIVKDIAGGNWWITEAELQGMRLFQEKHEWLMLFGDINDKYKDVTIIDYLNG